MKKVLLAAAFVAGALLLSGCATTAGQTPAETTANLAKQVQKACAVVQPTILSLKAQSAQLSLEQVEDLAKADDIATKVCTAAAAVPVPTSVADLIQSAFPVLIQIINAAPLLPGDKATVSVALTAAQVALSVALAQ